jgi:plastocyanin
MHKSSLTFLARGTCALVAAFALVACASSGSAGWTYAPLGPSPSAGAGQSGVPASPGGSPQGSPAGSPGGSPAGSPGGIALNVSTEQSNQLAFTPNTLTAPANTSVTVNYTNNSNQPHNIVFFNGSDSSAPKLAETEIATGPNALRSATFTTPAQAGNYYFWCQVHQAAMSGTLQVQ